MLASLRQARLVEWLRPVLCRLRGHRYRPGPVFLHGGYRPTVCDRCGKWFYSVRPCVASAGKERLHGNQGSVTDE